MSQSFFGGPLRSFRKSYRDFAETKWAARTPFGARFAPLFPIAGKALDVPEFVLARCLQYQLVHAVAALFGLMSSPRVRRSSKSVEQSLSGTLPEFEGGLMREVHIAERATRKLSARPLG